MSVGKEFLQYPVPNDPNTLKFAEERCCIIDAKIAGGNSGGPIMSQPRLGNRQPRLLGLVIAESDKLDFGIIEPVSRIRETLDKAKSRPASGRWTPIVKTKPVAAPNAATPAVR